MNTGAGDVGLPLTALAYFPTHPLDGRDMFEPFAALSRSAQRELKEEAGRLEAFLAD